jgi:hypothetical protein
MNARAFLIRGLLAGLIAGFATFCVAYAVGEPHVQAAINVEEAHSAEVSPATAGAGHHHEEDGTVVSRHNQRTWGLLTGTLGIGTALGGIVALVSAGVVGRIGRLTPGQSTALVALLGWVTIALVPFLKYPASPPAVGNPDTIGHRTGTFFAFMLISVVAAVVAAVLANRMWPQVGTYPAVLTGVGVYLVVVVVGGQLMPTVNEIGDFPAGTLWYFRRASLIVTATMWASIGVVLTGLVRHLHRAETTTTERRELAASL